jgi:hypothetical protein
MDAPGHYFGEAEIAFTDTDYRSAAQVTGVGDEAVDV